MLAEAPLFGIFRRQTSVAKRVHCQALKGNFAPEIASNRELLPED